MISITMAKSAGHCQRCGSAKKPELFSTITSSIIFFFVCTVYITATLPATAAMGVGPPIESSRHAELRMFKQVEQIDMPPTCANYFLESLSKYNVNMTGSNANGGCDEVYEGPANMHELSFFDMDQARIRFNAGCLGDRFRFSSVDKNGVLTITCESNPQYGYNRTEPFTPYTGPVKLAREFIFVQCDIPHFGSLRKLHFRNLPHLHASATRTTRTTRTNRTTATPSGPGFNVLMFQFDAMADAVFKRDMVVLNSYITARSTYNKHPPPSPWEVFTFKRLNPVGLNTFPNLMALYNNRSRIHNHDNPGLFKIFKNKGFATHFLESYSPQYPQIFRLQDRSLDSGFGNELLSQYGDQAYDVWTSSDGCIDNTWIGKGMLQLTLEKMVYESARKHSFFVLSNQLEAHYNSLLRARIIDRPATRMLHNVSNFTSPTLVFLYGDHGLHFGPKGAYWHMRVAWKAMQNRHPPLSILVPKVMLTPSLRDTLRHNMDQLVTPLDLHKTLSWLAALTGPAPITVDKNAATTMSRARQVNLLQERVSPERTCTDAYIPLENCGCFTRK